jgi:probable HAF family extracellular repeat protein
VLWQHGVPTDLGNLGGESGNIAFDINNRDQVVGQSNLPNDTAHHAFLWQKGEMIDLGTILGLPVSLANGINNKGQVVGFSQDLNGDFSSTVAWIWQYGVMTDLNTLIPTHSPWFLIEALGINDRGQIAGPAFNISTGDFHGYLLTPCEASHGDSECEDEGAATAVAQDETDQKHDVVIPENVRQLLLQRRGLGRFMSSPQNATLSDTPSASGPNVTLSPTSLTLPAQAIGTTSAAKTVTLKNTGTASLTISGIAITGTNAGDFAQTHTCRSSLAAGASCSISVTFKPMASGTRTAAVSVTDNAAGSPQRTALSGIGVSGETLTGYCVRPSLLGCTANYDPAQCTPGAAAIVPRDAACGFPPRTADVDFGRKCSIGYCGLNSGP